MDYNSIFPKLWIGSCPRSGEEIDRLAQEARINAILTLLTDEDIGRRGMDWPRLQAHCDNRGIKVHRVPVMDGDSADLREKLADCVCVLDHLLADGHTVYLHCVAGIERSPSVAIAYLHWCLEYGLEEAAAYVDNRRGCSPDVEAIRLATQDLLRADLVRERILRKAVALWRELSSEADQKAAWEEARRYVLRKIIAERAPV